jgi:nitroreductase
MNRVSTPEMAANKAVSDAYDAAQTGPAALSMLMSRQSHWPLVEPGPDDAALDVIFDAALRAPDHGRLRPWRFTFIRGEARAELGDLLVEAERARSPDEPAENLAQRRQRAFAAPVIIALGAAVSTATRVPETEQLLSAGAAAMNMLNAIHALGYGGFWATGPDSYDKTLQAALDFEESDKLIGFLFVGTPAKPVRAVDRPPRGNYVREWLGRSSI